MEADSVQAGEPATILPDDEFRLPRTHLRRPRRPAVLHLLADLAGRLGPLDLDDVDGEWYWRCCRTDLLDRLDDALARYPGLAAPEPRPDPRRMHAYLGGMRARAWDVLHVEREVQKLYPSSVWERLMAGERVPMRPPDVATVRYDHARYLLGRVFSGAWDGTHVERALRASYDEAVDREVGAWLGEAAPPAESPGTPRGGVSVQIDFSLIDDARLVDAAFGPVVRVPYVQVEVRLPLPPDGAIAREYDAIVREHRGWHRLLPGGTNRQEKEVALRTWAVALLMAQGDRFLEAMRSVSLHTGLSEASQPRFGVDRQRLLDRVPEAEPYLFAREKVTPAVANGVPPALLANPEEPLATG